MHLFENHNNQKNYTSTITTNLNILGAYEGIKNNNNQDNKQQ